MKSRRDARLKHEMQDIAKYPQFSLKIDPQSSYIWYIDFKGVEKTLYENESFTLRFKFDPDYVRKKKYNIIF